MLGPDSPPDFVIALLFPVAGVTLSWWLVHHLIRAWRVKDPTGFVGRPELAEVGVLALALYLVLSLVVPSLLGALRPEPDAEAASNFTLRVAVSALVNLLAIALAFLVGRRRHGLALADVGLRAPRSPLAFLLAAATFVAMAPSYFGVAALNQVIVDALGWDLHQQTVQALLTDEAFRKNPFTPILIVLVVPFVEEMLFRGVLQGALRAALGPWSAVAAATLLFALVHDLQSALPVFVIGAALGLLYETTGSILPSVLLHATFNGLQMHRIASG